MNWLRTPLSDCATAPEDGRARPGVGVARDPVAKAEAIEHAVTEIVDQHVGLPHELQDNLLALRRAQVEREAALVAVIGNEMAAVASAAEAAERIAAVAVLDLGHRGAEVGEQHPGKRAGDHGGELDDPDALERRHGQCPPATKPAGAVPS